MKIWCMKTSGIQLRQIGKYLALNIYYLRRMVKNQLLKVECQIWKWIRNPSKESRTLIYKITEINKMQHVQEIKVTKS